MAHHVRDGWNAALEWAAKMIETGYPPSAPPPNALDLAMTLRAKKNDVDMVEVGLVVCMSAFEAHRAALTSTEN